MDLPIDGFVHGTQRLAIHQQPQDGEEEKRESLHPAGLEEGTKRPTAGSAPAHPEEGHAHRACGIHNPGSLWGMGLEAPLCPQFPHQGSGGIQEQPLLTVSADSAAKSWTRIPCCCHLSLFKASGCGASCLGNTTICPWHFLPTSGAKRKPLEQAAGTQGWKLCPPFCLTLPTSGAGTDPEGSAWGMISEAVLQETGREMSLHEGVGKANMTTTISLCENRRPCSKCLPRIEWINRTSLFPQWNNLQGPVGQIQPAIYFCMTRELRTVFTFFFQQKLIFKVV